MRLLNVPLLEQLPLLALQVLHQQVFPTNLTTIPEVRICKSKVSDVTSGGYETPPNHPAELVLCACVSLAM